MKLTIEFDMNNDAFNHFPGIEASRILKKMAVLIEEHVRNSFPKLGPDGDGRAKIFDTNGNTIGMLIVTSD